MKSSSSSSSSSSSPLLFCLSLNPLSYLLDELSIYKVTTTATLTHLLYMDDLKLFATNDVGLQRLVDVVQMFLADIRMSFGIKNVPNCPSSEVSVSLLALQLYWVMKFVSCLMEKHIDIWVFQNVVVLIMNRVRKILLWRFAGAFRLSGNHYCVASSRCRPHTNSFCIPLLSYGVWCDQLD